MSGVVIEGVDLVRKDIDSLEKFRAEFDFIVDDVMLLLLRRIKQRFERETDPDGVKWTRSQRAINEGPSGRTLYDTGALFNSLQVINEGDRIRGISTAVPYAEAHNLGVGQVKRTFLGFSDSDGDFARDLVVASLDRKVGF